MDRWTAGVGSQVLTLQAFGLLVETVDSAAVSTAGRVAGVGGTAVLYWQLPEWDSSP